jgi:hypothetical protein
MDERKHLCPACNVVFDAPPLAGPPVCPLCNAPLPAPPVADAPGSPAPVARPPGQRETQRSGSPARNAGRIVAAAVVAFVGGTIVLAMPQWTDTPRTPVSAPAAPSASPEASAPEGENPLLPILINPAAAPDADPPAPRPGSPADPAPAAAVPPPDTPRIGPAPADIDRAIERGVAYLKEHVAEVRLPCRYEGLVGLALLECGVPPDDPVVRRIAASLRQQLSQLANTYEASLAILFFDRLDNPGDGARIRTLAEVLAAGQVEDGAWGYRRQQVPASETNPWMGGRTLRLRPAAPPRHPARPAAAPWTDHSNTQFAVLGLWVAGRHGRNPRVPLGRADTHYRQAQNADGGWAYRPPPHGTTSTLANTCSGLLALAAGHGINARAGRDARPLTGPRAGNDRAVARGLDCLTEFLFPKRQGGGGPRHDLYTLWSVERVATLYDLQTIGGVEWYPVFAHALLQAQQADGSWRTSHPPPIDTCFALLILRRSNLVPDLTAVIQGKPPPVRQPGLGWTASPPAGSPLSPGGPARTPPAATNPPPTLPPTGPAAAQPPPLSGTVGKVEPVPAPAPADPPREEKKP